MAFCEFELKKIEKETAAFMGKRRPPPEVRANVDLCYRIRGQSVELFEVRPLWDNPNEKMEIPIAKATFVRTQHIWKVYWQKADLKWHRYEPNPEVRTFQEFLNRVADDEYACFFG